MVLGSGMTISNVELLRYADGAIFGYRAKKDGDLRNPVGLKLIKQFASAVRGLTR